MMKRWMGAGLAIWYFSLAAVAQAQFGPPGKPALPEPVPFANTGAPSVDPNCPPSTLDTYNRAPKVPGAFQGDEGQGPRGIFLHLGAMALIRQRLGHGVISYDDEFSRGLDTGNPPPTNSNVVLDFRNIHPEFQWGERATLGYIEGNHAIEFTGFYLQDTNITATAISPGRLSSWFFNPPLGFEGDNGMFLQDDVVTATLRTAIGSAEFNYRWWNQSCWGVEWLVGIRYADLQERLSLFFGDDDLIRVDTNGKPDPLRQAEYLVRSHSRIVAPQIGVEWNRPILSWVTVGANAKAAIGPNFLEIDKRLTRGDSFVGFSKTQNATTFSQVYEAGVYADFGIGERIRARLGYTTLLFVHVPDAQSQVSYDLSNQSGRKDDGTIFYSGPIMELQFLF